MHRAFSRTGSVAYVRFFFLEIVALAQLNEWLTFFSEESLNEAIRVEPNIVRQDSP
jgi:hypothetical protein